METETPTPTGSSFFKQLGGAMVGIAVAGAVYAVVTWGSLQNIKGYLVNTFQFANPDQVRVSNANVDQATLDHLQARGQDVAAALASSDASSAPTMQQRAYHRAVLRTQQGEIAMAAPAASAPLPTLEVVHTAATAADDLPNSGPATLLLAVLSFVGAALLLRRTFPLQQSAVSR